MLVEAVSDFLAFRPVVDLFAPVDLSLGAFVADGGIAAVLGAGDVGDLFFDLGGLGEKLFGHREKTPLQVFGDAVVDEVEKPDGVGDFAQPLNFGCAIGAADEALERDGGQG